MKKITIIIIILIAINNIFIFAENYKPSDNFTATKPFVLFDYNNRTPMNNVNGNSGVFDFDPDDTEAYCRISYSKDKDLHKDGYNMKLSYDVNSTKPAFNGWWTKLNGINLSNFEAISITIKGDTEKGFSDFFKIELKDKTRKIEYIIENITDKWKQLIIPFNEFEGDLQSMDWKNANEFVIVFEDWRLKTKEGRYIIDDICFIPKKNQKVTFEDMTEKK